MSEHNEARWQWTKASLGQQTVSSPGYGEAGAFRAVCGRRGGGLCHHDFLQLVEQELLCDLGALQMNSGSSG